MTALASTKEEARNEALKFLQQHKTAALGTVSPDGAPHVAIVTCIFDDDFNVYFSTQRDTQKLLDILKEPRVAVTVNGYPEVLSAIQMEGRAEIIEDPQHLMVSYRSQNINIAEAHWQPLLKTHAVQYVFLKVKIDWARRLDLSVEGDPEMYEKDFQEIIARDA